MMAISQLPKNPSLGELKTDHAQLMAKRFFPPYIGLVGLAVNALYRVHQRAACRLTMDLLSTALRRKVKPQHERFYAAGERQVYRCGKHHFYTYRYGQGPAVLLLHGWCGHGARWIKQVEQLVAEGFQAIVMDAPGHGRSPGRFLSVPDYIQCVKTVLDGRTEWHSLLTHSMGSLVGVIAASECAYVHADTRFVLMNTFADCDRLMSKFIRCLGIAEEVLAATRAYITSYTGKPLSYFSLADHFQRLNATGLLISDCNDIVVPPGEAELILAELPQLTYRPTQGLGHHLRSDALMQEITDFVKRGRQETPFT
ncbi:MAG: alpha/beta fold hydrolase [Bacteroidota bacterium]